MHSWQDNMAGHSPWTGPIHEKQLEALKKVKEAIEQRLRAHGKEEYSK